MDEFNKIQELTDDIMKRKEPSFDSNLKEEEASEDTYQFLRNEENPLSDITLEKETGISKKYFIGTVIALIVVGGVGFPFFASHQDTQPDEIITISPSSDPVRVKPEQPGGAIIPDQDKMLYNRVAADNETPKIEKLFPEPEKPVLPEIIIQKNTPEPTFISDEEVVGFNPLTEQAETVVDRQSEMKEIVSKESKTVVKEKDQPKKEVIKLPLKTEVVSTPKQEKKTEYWRVQLLSTTKKASAEKAWPTILKKNKALLSNMSHEIAVATIPGKGTFYRLQAGQFTSKEMVTALCKKLKAQKQECVPVKMDK